MSLLGDVQKGRGCKAGVRQDNLRRAHSFFPLFWVKSVRRQAQTQRGSERAHGAETRRKEEREKDAQIFSGTQAGCAQISSD